MAECKTNHGSTGGGKDIHFHGQLLAAALRYHLRDSGAPETDVADVDGERDAAATISRREWATFDDAQRLSWLLKVSGAADAPRGKSLGKFTWRKSRAKRNM